MNKMLPLGTVVSTIKSEEKLIIIGRISGQKEYQYVCVVYPYGYLDFKDFIYVKAEDIDKLFFLGDINY